MLEAFDFGRAAVHLECSIKRGLDTNLWGTDLKPKSFSQLPHIRAISFSDSIRRHKNKGLPHVPVHEVNMWTGACALESAQISHGEALLQVYQEPQRDMLPVGQP
jgi:hypothetical protein